jgi:hypothetical protein
MVRFVGIVIVCAVLALVFAQPWSSASAQTAAPKDQMFSGVVTAVGENNLTAVRSGSKESKTFILNAQTRFEGPKPQRDSRVTIRYVSGEDGDRAVSVIVRAPEKAPVKK